MKRKIIPLSVPNFSGNELKYVMSAIESEWVSTAGDYIENFEQQIAQYVHCKGAVACQSGTSGIHTALLVVGVNREDVVIVPTLTFIAAVNPVSYVGAEPIFMDCDDSLCMDIHKLETYFNTECQYKNGNLYDKKSNKRIKAIIVVHVFGNMADMERLLSLTQKYNIFVIEDATEALGTYYTKGVYKDCYAGTIGHVGVYSFNGNKIITTGGGGMIVSNNVILLEHARHLTTQAKTDTTNYLHDEIGYNYRMTNLQAALGLAQLEQLEEFIETKQRNYEQYKSYVENIHGLTLLPFSEKVRSNYWFYSLFCGQFKLSRDELIQHFSKSGIQTRPIWGLIHEQLPYRNRRSYQIEKAKVYCGKVINIPCSTSLKEEEIAFIAETIKRLTKSF